MNSLRKYVAVVAVAILWIFPTYASDFADLLDLTHWTIGRLTSTSGLRIRSRREYCARSLVAPDIPTPERLASLNVLRQFRGPAEGLASRLESGFPARVRLVNFSSEVGFVVNSSGVAILSVTSNLNPDVWIHEIDHLNLWFNRRNYHLEHSRLSPSVAGTVAFLELSLPAGTYMAETSAVIAQLNFTAETLERTRSIDVEIAKLHLAFLYPLMSAFHANLKCDPHLRCAASHRLTKFLAMQLAVRHDLFMNRLRSMHGRRYWPRLQRNLQANYLRYLQPMAVTWGRH